VTPALSPPPAWSALLDDATALAPGSGGAGQQDGLAAVLAAYEARPAPERGIVGSLAVPEHHLPDLPEGTPAQVRVVAEGGAGAVAGIARLASRRSLTLAALDTTLRDPSDLPGNARRVAAAVDEARSAGDLSEECRVHVELPAGEPSYGWLAAADVAAEAELRLRLRLGPDPVPPSVVVAWIDAALDRETPFAAVGIDRAVRGAQGAAHGFLNLALATLALWDGAGADEAERLLAGTDADDLAHRAREQIDELPRARRWLTACVTTAPEEALADLSSLGLLAGG
jgi:hypothetical protein